MPLCVCESVCERACLHMCLCACSCVRAHIFACVKVCLYACVRASECSCARERVCVCARAHVRAFVLARTYMCACACVCSISLSLSIFCDHQFLDDFPLDVCLLFVSRRDCLCPLSLSLCLCPVYVCCNSLCRLDYCNSSLSGCPKHLPQKVQKVHNSADRLVLIAHETD